MRSLSVLKQTSESEYFGRYKIGSKKKCRLIYNIQLELHEAHVPRANISVK